MVFSFIIFMVSRFLLKIFEKLTRNDRNVLTELKIFFYFIRLES